MRNNEKNIHGRCGCILGVSCRGQVYGQLFPTTINPYILTLPDMQLVIEFATNYTLPEIVITGYNGVAGVSLREITKGIDSISYLGGGR